LVSNVRDIQDHSEISGDGRTGKLVLTAGLYSGGDVEIVEELSTVSGLFEATSGVLVQGFSYTIWIRPYHEYVAFDCDQIHHRKLSTHPFHRHTHERTGAAPFQEGDPLNVWALMKILARY
jgi:hypothetical protein